MNHAGGSREWTNSKHIMKLWIWLKHELKEVGIVTLYFFGCFGVVLLLKKLMLAAYQVEVNALASAALAALIAAKVVIILDKTGAGARFDAALPLGWAAVGKTLIYALAAFAVLFAEKLFHAWRHSGELGAALGEVWEVRDRNLMLAKTLCAGLAFLGYHLYAGVDRQLGRGTLRGLLTVRAGSPRPAASVK